MSIQELLSEKGNKSMMRFAVFFTLMLCGFLGLVLGTVLIIKAYRCQEMDWSGSALFLGAIAATITGVTGMKAIQKGKEKPIPTVDTIIDSVTNNTNPPVV